MSMVPLATLDRIDPAMAQAGQPGQFVL